MNDDSFYNWAKPNCTEKHGNLGQSFLELVRAAVPSGKRWRKVYPGGKPSNDMELKNYTPNNLYHLEDVIDHERLSQHLLENREDEVVFDTNEWKKICGKERPPLLNVLSRIKVGDDYYAPVNDASSQTENVFSIVQDLRRARVDKKMLMACAGLTVTLVVFSLHLFSDRKDWYWKSRNYCYMSVILAKCIMLILLVRLNHSGVVYRGIVTAVALASGINACFSFAEVHFGESSNKRISISQTDEGGSKWKAVDVQPKGERLQNQSLESKLNQGITSFSLEDHKLFGIDKVSHTDYVYANGKYYSQSESVFSITTKDIRMLFVCLALLDVVLAVKALFTSEHCRPGSLRIFDFSL